MQLRTFKLNVVFLFATLAVTPIAVSFALGLWENGAEDISAAAVSLACFIVMSIFVLSVKAFVLDDSITVAKVSRQVVWSVTLLLLRLLLLLLLRLLLLQRLLKCIVASLLHPLRTSLLRPDARPDVVLNITRLSADSETPPRPSSSWPKGNPTHVRYH